MLRGVTPSVVFPGVAIYQILLSVVIPNVVAPKIHSDVKPTKIIKPATVFSFTKNAGILSLIFGGKKGEKTQKKRLMFKRKR
jgi:hypothetical protein